MFFSTELSALTLAAVASLAPQNPSLPEPMVQAARMAVASSPEVQARWSGFKAAGNEREVARGSLKPQLDLNATAGREDRTTPLTNFGRYNFNTTQLTLTQLLFDGKFTASEVKRLGFAVLTRYYELLDASETIALEAVRAYVDVVRHRELVDAATQNYVEHKQITLLVEERAAAGVGRRVDVEQANSRLALAESNLLTELTNLHDVSARYLRIVGQAPPASLPTLVDPFRLGPLPASADLMMRDGLRGSPSLNAAVENVRALDAAVATRQAAYQPRLELRAYAGKDMNAGGTPGNTQLNGVQLVLNYNLYRGGADQARERQAVDQKTQAQDLQEKVCRDVRQTLSIAYSDVNSLSEQRRYMDFRRLTSEKSLQAYRQQFDIGQRSLLDLLDSQNEFFEATRAYTNAHYNQVSAQARTLSGMGRLVATLGVARDDWPTAQDAGQDQESTDPTALCPPQAITVDTLDNIKAVTVVPPRVPMRRATPAAQLPTLPEPAGGTSTAPTAPFVPAAPAPSAEPAKPSAPARPSKVRPVR